MPDKNISQSARAIINPAWPPLIDNKDIWAEQNNLVLFSARVTLSHLARTSWMSLQPWISFSVRLNALFHRSSRAPPVWLTEAAKLGSVCSTVRWSRSCPKAALLSFSWASVCWVTGGKKVMCVSVFLLTSQSHFYLFVPFTMGPFISLHKSVKPNPYTIRNELKHVKKKRKICSNIVPWGDSNDQASINLPAPDSWTETLSSVILSVAFNCSFHPFQEEIHTMSFHTKTGFRRRAI